MSNCRRMLVNFPNSLSLTGISVTHFVRNRFYCVEIGIPLTNFCVKDEIAVCIHTPANSHNWSSVMIAKTQLPKLSRL